MSLLLPLAGCASPPLHRYLLGGAPPPAPPGTVVEALPPDAVELRPVLVPDHLDTREMLREDAAGQLAASPDGRWAERLSVGIRQALAADLQRHLPRTAVLAAPAPLPGGRSVALTVTRFDLSAGGTLTLEAGWAVGAAAWRARLVAAGVGGGDAAQAAAMGALLDRLAALIARDL